MIWFFLGPFSLIAAWYSQRISNRAKGLWTALVAVQAAVVVVIVIVLVSCTGGDDGAVQQFVEQNVASSVTGSASTPADATVTNVQAICAQATSSTWNCSVTYNLTAPAESIDQNYSASLAVTCD